MILKNSFLQRDKFIQVSKKRLWFSILLGLLSSLLIYSFLNFLAIVYNSLDFGQYNWALILTNSERYTRNLCFAVISVVLGNSIFLGWIFRRPIPSNIPNYKINAISNNQSFLSISFFYWYIKIFFVFIGVAYNFLELSIGTMIYYLIPLIGLVLFLESWKTILYVFRNKAYKYLFINFIVVLIFPFLLSMTSIFDYKKYEKIQISNNPYVNLPVSSFDDVYVNGYKNYIIKILLDNDKVIFNFNGRKFYNSIELTHSLINNDMSYLEGTIVKIMADRNVPLIELKNFEKSLFQFNLSKITYVTKYADSIENGRFTTKGLNRNLFFSEFEMNKFIRNNSKTTALPPPFHPQLESFLENKKIVDVRLADNKLYTQKDLVECFLKEVDSSTVFNYIYSDNISYQKWINTYSAHKQAVDELRVNKQTIKLKYESNGFRYINEDEYNEEQLLLKETFPFHVIENFESNSAKLKCS